MGACEVMPLTDTLAEALPEGLPSGDCVSEGVPVPHSVALAQPVADAVEEA